MGLTWIDHDIIEVPVEEVEVFHLYFSQTILNVKSLPKSKKAGTIDAEGLNLTIETLKQKDDNRLDADSGLVKKVKSNTQFHLNVVS